MVDRRGRPRAPGGGRKRPVELSSSSAAPKRGEEAKSPSVPSHASTLPSQPSSSSSSSQTWRPAKVPIPRLVVPEGESGSSYGAQRDAAEKQRVRHACEPCRSRKTKCSGERPTCAHCLEHRIECRYGDGKRDRAKRCVTRDWLAGHCDGSGPRARPLPVWLDLLPPFPPTPLPEPAWLTCAVWLESSATCRNESRRTSDCSSASA